jgi:hypothetical protein
MAENLFDTLNLFFSNLNFQSKKRIWYRKENDGFIVCQFQRFRFDLKGSGFLNFGVVFTKSNGSSAPKSEDTWDLRGRYKSMILQPNMDELFPIELTHADDKTKLQLALTNIQNVIIPYLTKYSVLDNLVNDVNNKEFDYSRAVTKITPK